MCVCGLGNLEHEYIYRKRIFGLIQNLLNIQVCFYNFDNMNNANQLLNINLIFLLVPLNLSL